MYASTFWSSQFLPRSLNVFSVDDMTKKMTIGFSNTPGPIKPFVHINPKTGDKSVSVSSHSYLMVAGQIGIILGAISSPGMIKITLSSDTTLMTQEENKRLLDMVYSNIMNEIERVKALADDKKE